jgi:hypothetical protein
VLILRLRLIQMPRSVKKILLNKKIKLKIMQKKLTQNNLILTTSTSEVTLAAW